MSHSLTNSDHEDVDLEKKDAYGVATETRDAADEPATAHRTGVLWNFTHKLAKYGVEEQGIERYTAENRTHKRIWAPFTMYMGFKDAALTIIFFNLLTAIPASLMSVWGVRTGMRQLAMSRYFFGYYTVLIPALLNCIACIGWSTVNAIVGGLCLSAVSWGSTSLPTLPVAAGIVIISIVTLLVSFMGYKFVHLYEAWCWIPVAVCFVIYAVEIAKGGASGGDWGGSGAVEAASVLSFGAAIAGFNLGWVSLAADYSCQLPENSSGVAVFFFTYMGICIPAILLEIMGAAAMTCLKIKPTWAAARAEWGIGGLLAAPLIEPLGGFGRFLVVILGLSIIGNNIPNIYSFALTAQVLGKYIQAIPRPLLTLFATAVYIALAIPGAHSFESALDSLLVLLAYWLSIYLVIAFEEHFLFRGGSFRNYDFDALNKPRELPMGIASFVALLVGWVGAILGMSTVFYVGVVGLQIGLKPFGGDIGFEMAGVFTAITYPILRYFERKTLEPKYWKKTA
ncbi:Purine-cytosine permease fcy21 [Cystobasidiomycetes sp. EMM_F5]